MHHKLVVALLAAGTALAQTPAFEVATIKPAPPLSPQAMMSGKMRIGENIDGARADYNFVNVEFLLTKAYRVKAYQVTGPEWIRSERYNVMAKLPEGATKDQIPDMLKTLLAERFKLEIRHETKEHPVYALVVGRNGSKLKESAPEAPAPPVEDEKAAKGGFSVSANGEQMKVSPGGDGRSMTVKGPMGNISIAMGSDGNMQMKTSQMTIPVFIDQLLGRFVDKPVIDQTDLKGKYDFALDLSMADMMNIARSAGIMAPGMGGGRGGAGVGAAEAASDPSGGSIFQAVQSLGLKLEPQKLPLEMIVVDKGDKVPTEN